MDNKLTCDDLKSRIKVNDDDFFHIFLGAGASVSSDIKTGQQLVWEFKKEIFCEKNEKSPNEYSELSDEQKKEIQNFFDHLDGYPPNGASNEYSFYFYNYLKTPEDRSKFIQKLVKDKKPQIGYQVLGKLIIDGKFKNIWTTNFDELIEHGIRAIDYTQTINVYSSSNPGNAINNNQFPSVTKLHGDFRYDYLKNTEEELKSTEDTLAKQFKKKLIDHGLIVIGYSGNDESIKKLFDEGFNNQEFLNKGLFWLCRDSKNVSDNVLKILEKAKAVNEYSSLIEISDFDNFMKSLFIYLGYDLSAINNNYPSLISNNPQEAILNSENSIIQNVPKIKNEIETISQAQENSTTQINDNENEKNIGEEKNKEKAKNKTINQAQDSSTTQINSNEKEKNIVEKNNNTNFECYYNSKLKITPKKIEEFYLPFYKKKLIDEDNNTATIGIEEFKKVVIKFIQEKQWNDFSNIALRGIAGIGKTLELYSLYNEIIDMNINGTLKEKCIPIFINLSNYTNTAFNFITNNEKYLIFIDGFDEICDTLLLKIQKQLMEILSLYSNIRIIISLRNRILIDEFEKKLHIHSFILQRILEKENINSSDLTKVIINDLGSIPISKNIESLKNTSDYKKYLQNLLSLILIEDKRRYDNSLNITYRRKDLSKINLNVTEQYLKQIAFFQVTKNKSFITESELYNLIENKEQFEFILKSSLFEFNEPNHIYFVSEIYLFYYCSLYILNLPFSKIKNIFFTSYGKIKEQRVKAIQYILNFIDYNSKLYTLIIDTIKNETLAYILLTNYNKLSPIERINFYKSIIKEFDNNTKIIYYARFIQTHDLLENTDSLSDSMHNLLPEVFYDEAVKLHCDTIKNFLKNPTIEDITTFENAVILLGVHDKFWKEKQYPLLKEVAVPLIRFFRENEIAKKMKGLLSEDIILSWYEEYDWTINWEEKEWATFVKEIANISNTEFFNLKNENEFRIKLKLFNHFHSNFYIRRLLVPLTVKILENKNLRSGEASFVPNSLDDDFETPTIHFDNDISYFSYTIKNYEIPISDLLYILNSIDCNYVHHNYAYQLEELYRDLLKSFKEDISKIQDDEIPVLYTLFKKYINTDDGMFISDFNAYIKLLNDKHKESLFNLLLSDLINNTNWQNLWMLHNSIVILLDIKNKDKAISLCEKLKKMKRVYGECIADIYIPNLKEHPLYDLSKKEYPLLFPQTVKKDEEHKKLLFQFEANKKEMLEKEISIISNKEKLLGEINNIFKYLDETKDSSERDTDRGRLLDLQVDYIGNKLQYAYKEEYKIPEIFSSFALTYLFNFTNDDQSLNRPKAIKNIEEWFADDKYFWRYFFWLYICHYKKEETDEFLNKNPSLIERIKESMQQEVSYFSAENELSLYDGGRNRFWVVPFVHYLSRFYSNKLPEWFEKNKILNFIAYPAWQLSTGYGVHINGEFKWESWNSVFDWIRIVSDIDEDMIIEKSLSILPELKSDQSITQIVTVFVEKIKTNEKYKQQMLDVIINKTIEELQRDYKDHNEKSIMNGGALSSFWRETQEDLIDKLYPYVDFSKYNTDDINYCRRSVFEYICKNANENERAKIIESLKNQISEKAIRIYLSKLGYDKAIILTINDFLNGENFNTDYAFYSSLFGKSTSSLRLLNKYFQLYEYSLGKKNDRRDYLIGYAKEGILQTTTKTNFWFIKKKLKQLIKRLKNENRYFEGVEDFLNEIEQRSFDDN